MRNIGIVLCIFHEIRFFRKSLAFTFMSPGKRLAPWMLPLDMQLWMLPLDMQL